MNTTRFEDIEDRLRLADVGEHALGHILIAVGTLVEIVEEHASRIAALESRLQAAQEMVDRDPCRPKDEPHAFVLVVDGEVREGWIAPSRQDALISARRWYAVRRAMAITDDANAIAHPDLYDLDPDPATATIEDISAWYAGCDTGCGVQIVPILPTDVVADCLGELSRIADSQVRETYRAAILAAVDLIF